PHLVPVLGLRELDTGYAYKDKLKGEGEDVGTDAQLSNLPLIAGFIHTQVEGSAICRSNDIRPAPQPANLPKGLSSRNISKTGQRAYESESSIRDGTGVDPYGPAPPPPVLESPGPVKDS
ncbi:hypothetical protein FRC14_008312, partial [Serendipita sp. 396]